MDVTAWLKGLGLGQYERLFHDHAIDLEVLPELGEADLEKLGILLGHRKRLLKAIAALGAGPTPGDMATGDLSRHVEGGRRQVTVLFADLCGFTRLGEVLDPEEVHALLGRFFEATDNAVEQHGGTVDKHVGDSVMAVFGAPVAHSDDPERAVRAALAIHDAMRWVGSATDQPLAAHIGVATGQVVAAGTGSASHRQYTVTGEAANLAARLTSLAGPGETLVADTVHRLIGERMDADGLGDLRVKGLERSVRAWRLRGLRDPDTASRPLVGRRAELAQLEGALGACRETGRGLVVHVRGEAGIGKTRLVEEFRRVANDRGFACHVGLVVGFGTAKGRDAVRTLVRSLLGLAPRSGEDGARRAAERAAAEGLIGPNRRVFLNDLLELPQPVEMLALYDAMDDAARNRGKRETAAELVRQLAVRRPILLVLEDLHWADPATLTHAAELATAVAERPAVLVLTSRDEGDPLDALWRGATRRAPMMTIDLGPLHPEDAMVLAGSFGGAERLLRTCVERSGGHPLFLEQLLRGAEELDPGTLPGSVQSAVLARVDVLDPAERQALQAASVLGQRFTPDALRHLLGNPRYGCERLVAHHLVRLEGEDCLFAHALIQEGVYASLLHARRRELHRHAAVWYAGRDPALHAEHLDRAEDPAAPQAYALAARAEAAAYRNERALRLTERGLALADRQNDIHALTCVQGEIQQDLGAVTEATAAYERALAVARDDAERCRAWIGVAAGMRETARYEAGLSVLERAEAAAVEHGLVTELARVHWLRGNMYFSTGNTDGCLREQELALAGAREARSPELEARALSGLGDAYYARGQLLSAHHYFRRCLALCRVHGFGRIEVANLHMAAMVRCYADGLPGARDDALAAVERAQQVGHPRSELVARVIASFILYDMAELEQTREQVERARELAIRLGARRYEVPVLVYAAKVLVAEGRVPEAHGLLEQAAALSLETGPGYFGARTMSELALVTAGRDAQQRTLGEAERLLRQGAISSNSLWYYRNAIEAALLAGDWQEAERLAAALEGYNRPEPLPWADLFVVRGRALATYGRCGRDESALQQLRTARDMAFRLGLKIALPALQEALAEA